MASSPSKDHLHSFLRGFYGLVIAVPFILAPTDSKSAEPAFETIGRNRSEKNLAQRPRPSREEDDDSKKVDQSTENSSNSDSTEESVEPSVLITEIIIEGIGDHPDRDRLQLAAYDAMSVRRGGPVTRDDLQIVLETNLGSKLIIFFFNFIVS